MVTFVAQLHRQLKATDDLQSHYVSFLNHDLRGGMNGILLMVEVLKRELGGDPKFGEVIPDLTLLVPFTTPDGYNWVGYGLPSAVLAVFAYRVFNLWLPLVPALSALPSVRRSFQLDLSFTSPRA